jgi:hypothetical protein
LKVARVIVGDGRAPIENAHHLCERARIQQVGPLRACKSLLGDPRKSQPARTVMPMIVDTHVHPRQSRWPRPRPEAARLLWVSAAQSMGTNKFDLLARPHGEHSWRRTLLQRRPRITRPEPGRDNTPYWVDTEAQARAPFASSPPTKSTS